MKLFNKIKNGQSLPLNTIVIAMLVIVVLLVIIVFFTSSVGKSGKTIDANSPTACSLNNPAISSLGYTKVEYVPISASDAATSANIKCNDGFNRISFIPSIRGTLSGDTVTVPDTVVDGTGGTPTVICCGKK